MSDLPQGWARALVDDTGDYINGMAFKPSDWETQGRPIIRIQNLTDPEKIPNRTKREVEPRYLVERGDILVSWSATLDAFIWDREQSVLNQHIFKVVPTERALDSRFLFHGLRAVICEMIAGEHLHGSTMKHINRGPFLAHPFPLPPLPEQRRIVAKMDSLTGKSRRARDHLDHIPRLVEKYKQAILAAAFRGDLTRDWRETNGLSSLQSVRLPELLAEPIRNGLSVRGSDAPPGVRALRLSALRGGKVDLSDVRYLPITTSQSARFLLCEGDVLVSRGNGTKAFVGLAALVGAVEFPTIFPDTAFRLRLAPSAASPSWLVLIWNAPPMREQIERAAKTTAGIWKISQGNLNQVDILLPLPEEQAEIVRRIESAFTWIDRLAADATSARKLIDHLDQAVLAKAFKGELVPQNPADEPASILLERIRAERAAVPKAKRGRKKTA